MRGEDEFKRAQGAQLNPPETGVVTDTPNSPVQRPNTIRERLSKTVGVLRSFMDILPGLTFNQIPVPMEHVNTGYAVTTTGKLVAGFNLNRGYLLIQNHDTSKNIYVTFGSNKVTRHSVKVVPGGYYEPVIAPISDVYVRVEPGSLTSANIVVVEGIPSTLKRDR